MALICHRFDTKGFAAFPRGCHQPESPDTQDFSALHHRIYHVAPFGTGVRCVPSASDRCASHSAVRAKLKIPRWQHCTGSSPVTGTRSKRSESRPPKRGRPWAPSLRDGALRIFSFSAGGLFTVFCVFSYGCVPDGAAKTHLYKRKTLCYDENGKQKTKEMLL